MTRTLTALAGIGLAISGTLMAPSALDAQSGVTNLRQNRVPDPNAKRVMVTVFKGTSSDPKQKDVGVKAADELRSRIGSEFPFKQVYVLPKTEINSYLEASGFPTTEPLAPHDARALASLVRADEYVTGIATHTAAGFKIEANMVLARDNSLVQPLGVFEAPKMGDVMKLVSQEMKDARKQLEFEQKCINSAREKKYPEALAYAKEGVVAYPKATLARICQANVMVEMKASQEELLAVSREIVNIDARSSRGLALMAQAFKELKMEDSAVVTLTRLLATDPTNPRLQQDVVRQLAEVANPRVARPVVDEAVAMNPGEPDLLRLRWLILLAVRDYKEAFAQGEDLVKLDTSFADTTYFIRTSAAYQADSQFQKAAETAAKGLQKFAAQPSLTYVQIAALKQAGQNQQSLEVLDKAIESKIPVENAGFLRIALLQSLGRNDEVLPAAKALIASGDTSTTLRQMVVQIGNDKLKAGQANNSEADYEMSMSTLRYADSVSTGETKVQAQFLIGAVSVTYGNLLLNKASQEKNCAMAKRAKDMFVDAQIMLPRGGATYVEAMRTLMGAVMQLDPAADAQIKALCK